VAELSGPQREELEAIRQRFALKIPDKVRAIEQAAELLGSETPEPGAAEHLGQLAHGLAGSAAIFGFRELAEATAQLEALVASRPENATASSQWNERVANAVRRVRQASA
jgi:HPt (histidine-containing phosphotransfer) domain-containing protein